MFGRSTPSAPPPEEGKQPLTVQGIPQEFYGGANPVIHFKTTTREVDVNALNGIPVADQKAHEQQSAAGGTSPSHPVHFFSDPKKMLMASAAVLGVAVLGAGGYYLVSSRSKGAPAPASAPSVAVVTATPATPSANVTETKPVVTEPIPTILSAKIDTPSLLLGDTIDDDRDLLTDQEESLYRSDPGVDDSDNDSYPDAHETYFLYSPTEKEPSRLLNSGAVTEYTNPSFGYRMFYPTSWLVGSIDPDNRDVLFTSIGGDYVEVRVFDRPLGTAFADWLAQVAPNERLSDLMRFTTRAEEPALGRQDYLVYYFVTADKIIAMLYHPGVGQTEVAYRSTMLMMARSFRASGALESVSVGGPLRELGERKKSFITPPPSVVPAPVEPSQTTSTVVTSMVSSSLVSSSASALPTSTLVSSSSTETSATSTGVSTSSESATGTF